MEDARLRELCQVPSAEGGDMKTWYHEVYLLSPRWKTVRQYVIERDGGICKFCGNSSGLQVHHLSYDNLNDKDATNEARDCITLCERCHHNLHEALESIQVRAEYKKAMIALVMPALAPLIKARQAEIEEGARLLLSISGGRWKHGGNSTATSIISEAIRNKNSYYKLEEFDLLETFLPPLSAGIMQRAAAIKKKEARP